MRDLFVEAIQLYARNHKHQYKKIFRMAARDLSKLEWLDDWPEIAESVLMQNDTLRNHLNMHD